MRVRAYGVLVDTGMKRILQWHGGQIYARIN
jgi:hypothetical protein